MKRIFLLVIFVSSLFICSCTNDEAKQLQSKFNEEIKVENIDKTAPEIDINILTKEYGDTLEFEVEYGDSTKKEYKIGEKGTYKPYSGKVSVKANDVLNQVNEDGSLTIYAKGTETEKTTQVKSQLNFENKFNSYSENNTNII